MRQVVHAGLDVEPLGQRALIDAGEAHDLNESRICGPVMPNDRVRFVEAAPVEARDIVDNEGYMMLVHPRAHNKCAY